MSLTRKENYLALIAGDERGKAGVKPLTVKEELLDKISKTGGPLPAAKAADEGKVPTVKSDGTYELKDVPTELPAATADDSGKFLGINAQGKYALDTIPTELPAVTADDNGKVLMVVDGAWTAASLPT